MSSSQPPEPVPGSATQAPPSIAEFVELTYTELHTIARAMLRSQPGTGTLQATSLLHDAFVRMSARAEGWNDKEHFIRSIGCAMRSLLVDHARARAVRGVRRTEDVAMDVLVDDFESVTGDLVRLDEALEFLGRVDPGAVRIVELRYFAALSVAECAEAMGISKRQAERELQFARGWLRQRLT